MTWNFSGHRLPQNSFFAQLMRGSDKVRQFDALWAMSDGDLETRGLKRQNLATLILTDPGLN